MRKSNLYPNGVVGEVVVHYNITKRTVLSSSNMKFDKRSLNLASLVDVRYIYILT